MALPSIEVVEWNTRRAKSLVRDLVRDVFANREPGFQIDGIDDIQRLYSVFDVVMRAMPAEFRKHFILNSYQTGLKPPKDGLESTAPPHLDLIEQPKGVAIHQNIQGKGKLLLAHVIGNEYIGGRTSSIFEPDYAQLEDIRTGTLKDGRLTVFAEGGYGSMQPALHFFDRRGQEGSDLWVRYGYSPEAQLDTNNHDPFEVRRLAQTAFSLFEQNTAAA
jgi:hypothetical protein